MVWLHGSDYVIDMSKPEKPEEKENYEIWIKENN